MTVAAGGSLATAPDLGDNPDDSTEGAFTVAFGAATSEQWVKFTVDPRRQWLLAIDNFTVPGVEPGDEYIVRTFQADDEAGSNPSDENIWTIPGGFTLFAYAGANYDPDFGGYNNAVIFMSFTHSVGAGDYSGTPMTVTYTFYNQGVAQNQYLEVAGSTTVTAVRARTPNSADVVGSTTVTAECSITMTGPAEVIGDPDDVAGSTTVTAATTQTIIATPDVAAGVTLARIVVTPDLTDNVAVELSVDIRGQLEVTPPEEMDDPPPDMMFGRLGVAVSGGTNHMQRLIPTVSVTMQRPLIVDGRPLVPANWGDVSITGTATQGWAHIHARKPAPEWDPATGGWTQPPPDAPDWAGRWVVDDLPDPPDGGYYWLGDASNADGTGGYAGGRTRWAPHASTPKAPAWRSFFPYKPSVRAFDAYLPGGNVVHHPKGVHFNTHFAEHMWADFGGPRPQPFTWVIAGMVVSYPTAHYRHWILDAGRNPDRVGYPRRSAFLPDDSTIHDGLDYRTALAYSPDNELISTDPNLTAHSTVRARVDPQVRPKMFFGVFNGAKSEVGAYGPGSRRHHSGRVDTGSGHYHRYYVLGRQQNHIGQMHGAHMILFELRYWRSALTLDQLDAQYKQLAGTYHFHRYKSV